MKIQATHLGGQPSKTRDPKINALLQAACDSMRNPQQQEAFKNLGSEKQTDVLSAWIGMAIGKSEILGVPADSENCLNFYNITHRNLVCDVLSEINERNIINLDVAEEAAQASWMLRTQMAAGNGSLKAFGKMFEHSDFVPGTLKKLIDFD